MAASASLNAAKRRSSSLWSDMVPMMVRTAAVRTIIGTMSLHKELERRFAAFKDAEAAILLQSGFATNVAVCQTLMSSEEDLLVSDELNHASIIDGARLAKAPRKIYPHKDLKALETILKSPEEI